MTGPTVDAIICYHNHQDVILDCLHTLKDQIRQAILVDDGSGTEPPTGPDICYAYLRRDQQHSPASSFNYGAAKSDADWLLYVDPHNLYQAHAVQQMLALADQDGYDLILGTGTNYVLDASDPWIHALGPTLNTRTGPWTFLLSRRQWDQWQGIPESEYAHMESLAERLLRTGVLIGVVEGCCDHVINRDLAYALTTFLTTGRAYARLETAHPDTAQDAHAVTRLAGGLTADQIAVLWDRVFTSLYILGAVEGLNQIPQTALSLHLTVHRREPPSSGCA